MGEAPDPREQEDCPSGDACKWSCDLHEDPMACATPHEVGSDQCR